MTPHRAPLRALFYALALSAATMIGCGDDAIDDANLDPANNSAADAGDTGDASVGTNGGTTSTNGGTTSTNSGTTSTNSGTTSTNSGTTSTNSGTTTANNGGLDAGDPDADEPDADLPDADTPDADTPDADTPDADTPDADTPDVEPDAVEPQPLAFEGPPRPGSIPIDGSAQFRLALGADVDDDVDLTGVEVFLEAANASAEPQRWQAEIVGIGGERDMILGVDRIPYVGALRVVVEPPGQEPIDAGLLLARLPDDLSGLTPAEPLASGSMPDGMRVFSAWAGASPGSLIAATPSAEPDRFDLHLLSGGLGEEGFTAHDSVGSVGVTFDRLDVRPPSRAGDAVRISACCRESISFNFGKIEIRYDLIDPRVGDIFDSYDDLDDLTAIDAMAAPGGDPQPGDGEPYGDVYINALRADTEPPTQVLISARDGQLVRNDLPVASPRNLTIHWSSTSAHLSQVDLPTGQSPVVASVVGLAIPEAPGQPRQVAVQAVNFDLPLLVGAPNQITPTAPITGDRIATRLLDLNADGVSDLVYAARSGDALVVEGAIADVQSGDGRLLASYRPPTRLITLDAPCDQPDDPSTLNAMLDRVHAGQPEGQAPYVDLHLSGGLGGGGVVGHATQALWADMSFGRMVRIPAAAFDDPNALRGQTLASVAVPEEKKRRVCGKTDHFRTVVPDGDGGYLAVRDGVAFDLGRPTTPPTQPSQPGEVDTSGRAVITSQVCQTPSGPLGLMMLSGAARLMADASLVAFEPPSAYLTDLATGATTRIDLASTPDTALNLGGVQLVCGDGGGRRSSVAKVMAILTDGRAQRVGLVGIDTTELAERAVLDGQLGLAVATLTPADVSWADDPSLTRATDARFGCAYDDDDADAPACAYAAFNAQGGPDSWATRCAWDDGGARCAPIPLGSGAWPALGASSTFELAELDPDSPGPELLALLCASDPDSGERCTPHIFADNPDTPDLLDRDNDGTPDAADGCALPGPGELRALMVGRFTAEDLTADGGLSLVAVAEHSDPLAPEAALRCAHSDQFLPQGIHALRVVSVRNDTPEQALRYTPHELPQYGNKVIGIRDGTLTTNGFVIDGKGWYVYLDSGSPNEGLHIQATPPLLSLGLLEPLDALTRPDAPVGGPLDPSADVCEGGLNLGYAQQRAGGHRRLTVICNYPPAGN